MKTLDAKGRIVKLVEPDAHGKPTFTTDIEYNGLGFITKITQHGADGDAPRVRTFERDINLHVTSATSPEACVTTYTYDGEGNIASRTDALGHTVTYTWDDNKRLIKKQYTDGTPTAAFDYSAAPSHTSFLDAGSGNQAKRTYHYNEQGKMDSLAVQMPGKSAKTYTVGLQYDTSGHVTGIVYPDGRLVSQGWNKRGLLYSSRLARSACCRNQAATCLQETYETQHSATVSPFITSMTGTGT